MSWFAAAGMLRAKAEALREDAARVPETQIEATLAALKIFSGDVIRAVEQESIASALEEMAAALDRRGREDITQNGPRKEAG